MLFLWVVADDGNHVAARNACCAFVMKMARTAVGQLCVEHTHATIRGAQCRVYNGGQMRGLASVLSGHRTQMDTMTHDWASMHEEGILDGVFAATHHSLTDVLTFYMCVLRRRREGRHAISDALNICVGDASLDVDVDAEAGDP